MAVHVTCPKCKGQPYLKGKYADMNKLQTAARNVSIPEYLPAAQELFARSGADAIWPEEFHTDADKDEEAPKEGDKKAVGKCAGCKEPFTQKKKGTFFEPTGEWLCKDCYAEAD